MVNNEIRLRAPEPEDLELLYEWENNTDIWHLGNTIQPFSKHTLRRYIENAALPIYEFGQLRLMIDLHLSNETIGTIDIFDFDPINKRAGIGILIGKIEKRKKTYAKSAIEILINYCKIRLDLKQVWCNILEDNINSIKLFTNLDFKLVGTKQQWIRDGEEFKNELLYQRILK